MSLSISEVVDANGLQCPMPLLKAKQALNRMQSGELLQLLATDAGSWRDIHAFVQQSAHELVSAEQSDTGYCYVVKCG